MQKFKIIYLIALTPIFLFIGIGANAIEVNCDSPIWRKKEICKNKIKNSRKSQYGGWYPFGFDKNGNPVSLVWTVQWKKRGTTTTRVGPS